MRPSPGTVIFAGLWAGQKTTHNAGATIRKLREAKGLTQDQLAAAVGMMRSNISRIEAAKHRPTLETLEKIAKALKVSVVDLVAGR
ncbi:MAG: helix-turn-helix domain-containing protein [Candidatus Binatia bacterium]